MIGFRFWLGVSVCLLGCSRQSAEPSLPGKPSTTVAQQANSSTATLKSSTDAASTSAFDASSIESQTAASPPVLFEEPTADDTGLRFAYSNGRSAGEYAIVESLGGGVGVIDFDADGLRDLYFPGGGQLASKRITSRPGAMFRNLGAWRFADVTGESHGAAAAVFTHGTCVGDIDADGFDDLAVSGYGGVQILMNQGDGTWARLPLLVTNDREAWSSSLALADLDHNGMLDLYVAHYVDWSWSKHPVCAGQGAPREVCAPREFAGISDAVYFNDGDFALRRESESIGLASGGKGLGVIAQDLNGDNRLDLYVANDTVDNFYYINDGRGAFTEQAVLAGVSGDDAGVSTGSMGLVVFDYNQDHWPDILVTNFERELTAIYRNDGRGDFFTFASRQAGLATYGSQFVGFGAVALDVDHDGDQDVIIANGHVSYHSPQAPYRQQPLLLMNERGVFSKVASGGYFAEPHTGRGLASCDLDNDGDVDLAISHLEEPVTVLRRSGAPQCMWASLKLVGTSDARTPFGATVKALEKQAGSSHYLSGGGSYLSASDSRLQLYWSNPSTAEQPTAGREDCEVLVRWPSSKEEVFLVTPAKENVLVQGIGRQPDNDSSQ